MPSVLRIAKPGPALFLIVLLINLAGCEWRASSPEEMRADIINQFKTGTYAPIPKEPVSLAVAVEMALHYNLDSNIKEMEQAIKAEEATGAKLSLLPSMTLDFKRSRRSNERAAKSTSFKTKRESVEPSLSSSRINKTYNGTMAWNLLDFGLSFVRARQAEHQMLDSHMQYLRARQRLCLEVSEKYWRLVIASQAIKNAEDLIEKIKLRRKQIERHVATGNLNEMPGLEKQKSLAQTQIQLGQYKRDYAKAYIEFGKQIGMVPGASYSIVLPNVNEVLGAFDYNIKDLEVEALQNRPELIGLCHKEQVQLDEVRATILKMFPNVNLFAAREHDANPFLTHGTWHTLGLSATMNLLSLPQRWKKKRAEHQRVEVIRYKRMAMAVAIVTQVHLTVADLKAAALECREVLELDGLQKRLLEATEKLGKRQEVDAGLILERKIDRFFSRNRYLQTFANYMVTRERLANTLGRSGKNDQEGEAQFFDSLSRPPAVMAGKVEEEKPTVTAGFQQSEATERETDSEVEVPFIDEPAAALPPLSEELVVAKPSP